MKKGGQIREVLKKAEDNRELKVAEQIELWKNVQEIVFSSE